MRSRQTGQLLVAVLVLIAVIGAMVVAAGFLSVDDTRSATLTVQSGRALHAANSGLDYAAYRMRTDTTAFATTCTNLNNITQTVVAGVSSFTLTTTSVAAANTLLPTGITAAATTAITVTSAANFPSHGRMRIDSEEIVYTGKTATTFTGIKRGAAGSTTNAHANNAPVASEAQCVVRATGNAGTASRILESSFLAGPRAAFLDGNSTNLPANTLTTLGSLATTLPTGNNIVVAAISLQNTTATVTTINAGNLLLRNATTATTLGSNLYPVQVGGTANATNNSRSTKTHFIVALNSAAAANQTYDVRVTTAAGSGTTVAEVKILVINGTRVSASNTGNVAAVSNAGSTIVSLATTFPGTAAVQNAVNIIVASVHMDATSGNSGRTIGAGSLRLNRNAVQIDSNQFLMTFRANGNVNQEFSHLLIAVDSGAPASPTYSVTAIASNNNSFEVESKIVAFQGPAGVFVDGGSVALGTTPTTLGTVSANAFPALAAGANVAVIGSTQYIASTNAGGPYSIAVGAQNLLYNSVSQSTNTYQHFVCNTNTSNGECDHISGALLWLQTFAAANPRTAPTYTMQSAGSTAARINGETKLLAIQLEPIADRIEIF